MQIISAVVRSELTVGISNSINGGWLPVENRTCQRKQAAGTTAAIVAVNGQQKQAFHTAQPRIECPSTHHPHTLPRPNTTSARTEAKAHWVFIDKTTGIVRRCRFRTRITDGFTFQRHSTSSPPSSGGIAPTQSIPLLLFSCNQVRRCITLIICTSHVV